MPRIDTRRVDPLRTAREGREARTGSDRKYYDEYGFAMSPDEYKTFHSEVTKQNEAFDAQRANMMGSYEELSEGNQYDLGELWEDTEKLTIQVPYKGRTGSLGEIPKSSWKDFANAIQTSPHLGKRTSIWAPLEEDMPDYLERLEGIKELYTLEAMAARGEEYKTALNDYARSKGYYGTEEAPTADQGEGFGDARENYQTIRYDPRDDGGLGGIPEESRTVTPAEHYARSFDTDSFMYVPPEAFSIADRGTAEYEELKKDLEAAGYRTNFMGSLTYSGDADDPFSQIGAFTAGGGRIGQDANATIDQMIANYKQLNEEGIAKFTVGDKEYYRALFYEMPNITADVKSQWNTSISQQYTESQALLDTELANAELSLQGYIDEFQTGVGSFAEEYQRDQAAREEAFSGFTIG